MRAANRMESATYALVEVNCDLLHLESRLRLDNSKPCPAPRSNPRGLSQRLGSSAWGKGCLRGLSVSVSSITKNAVLCRVVFGGRILRGPWFLRLQAIVIAPPDWRLNAICHILQEMKDIIGAVSPRVAYCGRLNDVFPK